jgi:PAS domain S-box-containing protein
MNDKDKSRMQLLDDVKVLRMQAADSEKLIDTYQQVIVELKESEKGFRLIAENSHNWEYWLNVDDRLVYTSPSCKRLTGYDRDEFLKDTSLLYKIIHLEDRPLFDEHRRLVKKTQSPGAEEFRIIRKDGKTRWIDHVCLPVYDETGAYAGFRASDRDISEHKALQEVLQEGERRQHLITENISDMIWAVDLHRKLTYVTQSVRQLLGFDAEKIVSLPLEKILTPASFELVNNVWEEELKLESSGPADSQRLWTMQLEFLCEDGQKVWTESKMTAIRDAAGSLIEILASSRDITDRKNAEKTLRENEIKFRQTEKLLQETNVQLQEKDRQVQENTRQLQERENHLKESAGLLRESETKFRQTEKLLQEINLQLHEKDRQIQENTRQLQERENQLKESAGLLRERETSLLESAKRLRTGENQMRALLHATTESIFLVDINGNILFANETLAGRLGTDLPTLLNGQNIYELLPPDVAESRRQKMLEVLKTGKPVRFEDERSGRTILNSIYPIASDDGSVLQLAVFGMDITEHKIMTDALAHSAKLESLGMLAGGIAHDFNNLMTIVQGYIDMTMLGIPEDQAARQNLQAAGQAIEKTRALTGQLITFSRGGDPRLALLPVEKILRETVSGRIPSSLVKTSLEFQEDLWPAWADEDQICQCFYNLAENAVEAMPSGGMLKVRAENVEVSEADLLPLDEGAYLRIAFEDNGPGIPEEHLDKIFDPYFTTKEMGQDKGMGLGLTVCYSVLKKHGGYITAGAAEGGGAVFTLYLPAKPGQNGKTVSQEDKVFVSSRLRILVMEEHPEIRKLLQMYLEQLHLEATPVADGLQAVHEYRQAMDAGNTFSAVILTLSARQGLGGAAALSRIKKTAPDVKAIALCESGDPLMKDFKEAGFHGVLRKPFRFEEVKAVLKAVLS